MSAYTLLPLVQTATCLALAVIVLKSNLHTLVHRLFALYLVSLAVYGILVFGMRASPDIEHALSWERTFSPVMFLAGVSLYHFSTHYTVTKAKNWVIGLLYSACLLVVPLTAAGLIIAGMQIKNYGYAPIWGPAAPVFILLTYTLTVATLVTLIRGYKVSTSPELRNRTLYIITGIIISLIGGTFDVLPTLGLPLYPGFIIGNIIFCLITTVAILKHNLLDIHIVLRKGAAYFLSSLLIAIPFLVPFIVFTLIGYRVPMSPWLYIVTIILLALMLAPIWQFVQRRVDRWFYRDRYDYLKALQALSRDTQRLTDYDSIASNLVNLLARALHASSVHLLLPTPPDDDFTTISSAGHDAVSNIVIKRRRPLANWLRKSGEILAYRDLDFIPQLTAVIYDEKQELEQIGAELIIPLKVGEEYLAGLLIVGRKLSEQSYTIEDKELLRTVSSHVAVKLDNLRLYQEAMTTEKDLRTWLNNMRDCIVISSSDSHTVQFMNKTAMGKFGPRHGETCWSSLGKDGPCLHCPGDHHLAEDGQLPNFIDVIGDRYYEVMFTYLPGSHGDYSVIEVLRDITERKLAEEDIHHYQKQLQALASRLSSAEEQERRRLATAMHDQIGQGLAVIKLKLQMLQRSLSSSALNRQIDDVRELVEQVIHNTRYLTTELYPPVLYELGLEAALEWLTEEYQKTYAITCQYQTDKHIKLLDNNMSALLFQAVRELLTNVVKHAQAQTVKVSIEKADNKVQIEVVDDGSGFDFSKIEGTNHSFGLFNIKERLTQIGGQFVLKSEPGHGTRIILSAPLRTDAERKEGV